MIPWLFTELQNKYYQMSLFEELALAGVILTLCIVQIALI